ncbi:MAG: PfkB domain protein [Frankiales bacterium]|nr:PfkB domain protein [Frankiales bacterium]
MAPPDEGAPLDVVVVGSANLDVVLTVARIPRPGETVLATGRTLGPGGKGANQAAAAARSGARTALVAALGEDDGGALLRGALTASGVRTSWLRTSPRGTGTAQVVVDAAGENAIVVDPGANADLTDLTAPELQLVADARAVLAQLEVPLGTVAQALAAARGLRVLNAAPAQPLPPELTDVVDLLVVNEHEALEVSGVADLDAAVAALLQRVREVVVTLGPRGALLAVRGAAPRSVPGVPARAVVDTTGAGDVFCGALVAARAQDADPVEAVRTACAAASLSVERAGAGGSAPTPDQVAARLSELGPG